MIKKVNIFQRPILAFDVDGVLINLIPEMCKMCSLYSGRTVNPSDWTEYNYFAKIGMSTDEFLAAIIDYKLLERVTPVDGLSEIIADVRNQGLDTALITARGYHPNAEAITRSCFKAHDVEFDHVVVVGAHESKVQAIRSLGNVVAYTDDYLPHLHDIKNEGINSSLFLMNCPWNREDTQFQRVFSVRESVDRALEKYNEANSQKVFNLSLN